MDAPAGMTVCAHTGDVDRLTIGRVNSYPLGPVRWVALSPAFWSVLATAAGIGPAGQTTFSGTSP